MRDAISHCGGVIGNYPILVDKFLKALDMADLENPTENDTAAAKTATEDDYMAISFLSGLNSDRYGVLLNEQHNAICMGRDEYPKRFLAAYDL